jgi:hypothetical protein
MRRYEKEDSYLAQSQAIQAIASCGGRDVLSFLQRQLSVKSPRNVIASAAQIAIDKMR